MKLEKFRRKNPRKIGIAIFTVGCIFLLAFVFIYSSFASFQTNETKTLINGDVVDPGDLYFAFYVDGDGNFKPKCKISCPDLDIKLTKEMITAANAKHEVKVQGENAFDFDGVACVLYKQGIED